MRGANFRSQIIPELMKKEQSAGPKQAADRGRKEPNSAPLHSLKIMLQDPGGRRSQTKDRRSSPLRRRFEPHVNFDELDPEEDRSLTNPSHARILICWVFGGDRLRQES